MKIEISGRVTKFKVTEDSMLYELSTRGDISEERASKLISDFFANIKILSGVKIPAGHLSKDEKVKIEKPEAAANVIYSTKEKIINVMDWFRAHPNDETNSTLLSEILHMNINDVKYVFEKLKKSGFIYITDPLQPRNKRKVKKSEKLSDQKISETIRGLKEGKKIIMGTIQ